MKNQQVNIISVIMWLFIIFILGIILICITTPVSAQYLPDLNLKITKDCKIQYAGDSCIEYLSLTNNTGYVLNGEALLHIKYDGECGNIFDNIGTTAQFSSITEDWLEFKKANDNIFSVKNINIPEGSISQELKINTASNICPGIYEYNLQIIGKNGNKEYTTNQVTASIGGQYRNNYLLELQVIILQLKIKIYNILIQLKMLGK